MTVTNNGYEGLDPTKLLRSSTTIAFNGLAGQGQQGAVTVFAANPDLASQYYIARIWGYCSADLAGAGATVELFADGASLIASTVATTIDAGEIWVSTSPTAGSIALPAGLKDIIYAQYTTGIALSIGVADITAGVLTIHCDYTPMNPGYTLTSYTIASATLTGTAIAGGVLESEIVTGGQTIVITLANDTWITGDAFTAARQAIIDGFDSGGAAAHGWDVEKANIGLGAVVRTSDTVVTITLPALAAYVIAGNETITATIPAAALSLGQAITATPTMPITNE